MKFLKNIKNYILNSFNNNTAMIIYSIIIAILMWFVISITIYPTTPKTLSNIPLEIDITGTSAEENDLSVISASAKNVTVTIKGERSRIGSLTADDLVAKAVIENVNSAGEKSLNINVTGKDSDVKFEVTDIKPSKVDVMFDRIDTREYDLTVNAPNITAADGLYMDKSEFKVTPSVIEITGPSKQLDSIDKAQVYVDTKQEINTAYTFHSKDVVLYDKNESKINTDNLTYNSEDFTIDIPVYMQKELDFTYDIRYAPANFDISSLNIELNVDKINLASPNDELQNIDTWSIGSIPLYDLDWDFNKSFTIEVPSNYKNLSNVSTVTAKLNQEGLAKKTVTVNDISIVNAPSNYDCTVNTYGLTFDIIGPEDDIAEITEKDILVSVDLLKYTVQSTNFTADATISFPKYDKVWAVGLQKVSVTATPTAKNAEE
ncbi:MAG: CdaR family protein [Oscillospiraceae bacterium]|nr:CdaR family protein [Oscillospiraceae bacterium]